MAINQKLTIFSFVIFIIGFCLTYSISYIHAGISDKCVSNQVQLGMNILLILSIMMMIIPLIQLYCHWGCNCPQNDISYKWIIMFISLLILVVSSIVLNGLTDNCDQKEVKYLMGGLISSSSIIIIIIITLSIPRFKNILNNADNSDYTSSYINTTSSHTKNNIPNLD